MQKGGAGEREFKESGMQGNGNTEKAE